MKKLFVLLSASIISLSLTAQKKPKPGKYPSLLWEITGKGLKKSSYLFGTMHVSSKIAFHLSDSFYLGIKNADVVALETNPESWQEDMDKYETESGQDFQTATSSFSNYMGMPDDFFTISMLKFYKYDTKIENALSSNPTIINNLLYRTYGDEEADFEEDTYLDMYIYQCGKRWGKKVSGVENYEESMRLMMEAYKDAAKDKTPQKERSYDYNSDYSPVKLQEAYRNGNLDQLDSINKLSSYSAAFDEKFLYRRNDIQADGIDSIIKSGSTLFVGVGAAHLPGERGVIEILRRKGYKLRAIKIQERDSKHKEIVEKLRVPVTFRTEASEDGFFKVDIPGKFHKSELGESVDLRQYADMANGSYYMVTRIMSNAWLWNHTPDEALRRVDSLLYENVPGKIISKTPVTKSGYKGFDITNRTRRGDMQRYQVYVTPFEIIFFKISGSGDYVKNGTEAQKFFNSIQLKEYKNGNRGIKYSPPYGGFKADLPHEPYVGNDGSWIYDAEDKTTGTHYRIIRTDINNHSFVEEDSFDLSLMEESFGSSEFIARPLSRKFVNHKGYPALECKFKDKDSSLFLTRFIIKGPHYYTLIAHSKNESPKMQSFINSFELLPYNYNTAKERIDTSLYFKVKSPVYPEDKKIKLDNAGYGGWFRNYGGEDEDEETEKGKLASGVYRNKMIQNDTTGEKIYVTFFKNSKYAYYSDSIWLEIENEGIIKSDSSWITRYKNKTELPNKMKSWEVQLSDSGSSRMLWSKTFYKDGVGFSIVTQTDTLSKPSTFIKTFFETFTPADTLMGIDPFEKKTKVFFDDMFSNDSVVVKRAYRNLSSMEFDSADLPQLKKAISRMNWDMKKYLAGKKELIEKIGEIKNSTATNYLKDLYYAAGDTVELQYTILEAMLHHCTDHAYKTFRDIVTADPPVLNVDDNNYNYDITSYNMFSGGRTGRSRSLSFSYFNGQFFDELSDTLKLTRTILPDLLPLINLDDYEKPIMNLLEQMVDSNLVKPRDYEIYFSKFLIEAKQLLKKQAIAEKKRLIEKEENKKEDKPDYGYRLNEDSDYGNTVLETYAKLMLPFAETNNSVKPVLDQMLNSNDKKLKYHTLLLLIRHKKSYPDTMISYFAKQDEYRYDLYDELKDMKRMDLFPDSFNTHIALGKSRLLLENSYDKPDSVLYIDRLPAAFKEKKGFVYFYKVKPKKDDGFWKIATVGLIPEDPKEFEFKADEKSGLYFTPLSDIYSGIPSSIYDFTRITETKIKEDEPLQGQLSKILKKLLYSKRKSARKFYTDEDEEGLGRSRSLHYD
jgi:uncharacterized protein YbaP (TraB family)